MERDVGIEAFLNTSSTVYFYAVIPISATVRFPSAKKNAKLVIYNHRPVFNLINKHQCFRTRLYFSFKSLLYMEQIQNDRNEDLNLGLKR